MVGTAIVLVPLSLMAAPEESDMNARLLIASGVTFSNSKINIIGVDPGRDIIYMRVVAVSTTSPTGLFKVRWLRRKIAKIKLMAMNPDYCNRKKVKPPCYMVLHTDKRRELKAPRGMWWEVSPEEYEKVAFSDIYHIPQSGYLVHIDSDILHFAGQL